MKTKDMFDTLIIKAARRYLQDTEDRRYKHLVRDTRFDAFAEVAADVLGVCMTPTAFKFAIKDAVEANPHPHMATVSRDKAVEARREWAAKIVAAVRKEL